ncbi:MAG: Holliday junction resolvase RuvX [Firmicutes bacterium]|nr:Holliday junction resolvase RuvX [Bacillota bacterium]
MRLLGLDVGTATIGVAVSDPLGWTAQGVTTIRRQSKEKDLAALEEIVKQYGVEAFVLGLPLRLNGDSDTAVDKVRHLAEQLKERFGLPIYYQDERLTTVAAQRVLLEGDVSRRKRKQVVDKLAAVLILSTYMENPNNPK